MKKLIYFAFILTLLSCQKNDVQLSKDVQREQFMVKVNNYCSNFKEKQRSKAVLKGTRAWDWSKVVCVATADFLGAGAGIGATKEIAAAVGVATGGTGGAVVVGIGALVGSAGSSYSAHACWPNSLRKFPPVDIKPSILRASDCLEGVQYCSYEDMFSNDLKPFSNSLKSNTALSSVPKDNDLLASLGKLHNMTLQHLVEFDPPKIPHPDNAKYTPLIESRYFNLLQYDLQRIVYECTWDGNFDYNKYLEICLQSEFISEDYMGILSQFTELYQDYTTGLSDVNEITDGFVEMVNSASHLSESEKENLYAAFSVAVESPSFWQKYFEINP